MQFHTEPVTGPERRLMLAILEDALGIYRKYVPGPGRKGRRLIVETEQWLFSDDTGWPFSFVNVCQAVGIDVGWLRAQLRRPMPATTALEALLPTPRHRELIGPSRQRPSAVAARS